MPSFASSRRISRPRSRVPKADGPILAAGRDQVAVRRVGDNFDPFAEVAAQLSFSLAGQWIPNANNFIGVGCPDTRLFPSGEKQMESIQ